MSQDQELKDEKNPSSITELWWKDYNIVVTEEQDSEYFFTFYKSFSKQIL